MIKLTTPIKHNLWHCLAYDRPLIFLSFHLLSPQRPHLSCSFNNHNLEYTQIETFNLGISHRHRSCIFNFMVCISLWPFICSSTTVCLTSIVSYSWKEDSGKHLAVPQRVKPRVLHDPTIPLLSIYPRELK